MDMKGLAAEENRRASYQKPSVPSGVRSSKDVARSAAGALLKNFKLFGAR